jgi:hypothetical protein
MSYNPLYGAGAWPFCHGEPAAHEECGGGGAQAAGWVRASRGGSATPAGSDGRGGGQRLRMAQAGTAEAMHAVIMAADTQAKTRAAQAARMRDLLRDTEHEDQPTNAASSSTAPLQTAATAGPSCTLRSRPRGKTTKAAARHHNRVRRMKKMLAETRHEAEPVRSEAAPSRAMRKSTAEYVAALGLSSIMRPGKAALQELRYWFNLKMDLVTLDSLQDRLVELVGQQVQARVASASALQQVRGSILESLTKKAQREDRVRDAVIAVLKMQTDQRMARLEEEMAEQRAALEPPTASAPAPGSTSTPPRWQ